MIRRLFRASDGYESPLEQERANGLFTLTWLMVGALAVWLAAVAAPALISGMDVGSVALQGIIGAGVLVFILVLLQAHRLTLAAWLFVATVYVLCLPATLDPQASESALSGLIPLLIPLVAAGLLLNRGGLALVTVLVLATAGLRAYLQTNIFGSMTPEMLSLLITFVAVTVLLFLFGGHVGRALNRAARERAALRASAGFVGTLSRAHDEADVLSRTARLLRDEMGYPEARIYALDQGAVTSVVRPSVTTEHHSLSEADRAAIAQLVETGAQVIATQGNDLRLRLTAPLQTAVTVPVRAGEELIAAIDVFTEDTGFSPGELEAIRQLAAQLGMHLAELRLVEDLRRTIREYEAARTTTPLRDAPARRQSSPAITPSRVTAGYDLTALDGVATMTPDTDYSPTLRAALAASEPYLERDGKTQRLYIPVRHGDSSVGALTFDIPASQPVGERELALARMISERLGQAIENVRLFEQSQEQAARERKATEVANALISATDVRAVLSLAAESFNEAMGAVATRVTLQPDYAGSPRVDRAEGVSP